MSIAAGCVDDSIEVSWLAESLCSDRGARRWLGERF